MHRQLVVLFLALGCLLSSWLRAQAPSSGPVPGTVPPAHAPLPLPLPVTVPVAAPAPAVVPRPAPIGSVQFDSGGWPIVAEDSAANRATPPAPAGETRGKAAPSGPANEGSSATPMPLMPPMPPGPTATAPALASGMVLGSPLLEVFQAARSPAAFKALGGRVVWWRLTIYGAQGEVIGVREVTHTADCAFAERDRLEHADGRVYGRSGAAVFAERQGMPWPTLAETAQHELALFGLQLRLPWCFGDATTFSVQSRDTQNRAGDLLARIGLERRPPPALDFIGPEVDPRPRDRFELLYEPSGGELREFVQRFANSMQARRVLLEDWRDVEGVRMPHRRIYVDETLRQTTALEILRIEAVRTSERDFRLH